MKTVSSNSTNKNLKLLEQNNLKDCTKLNHANCTRFVCLKVPGKFCRFDDKISRDFTAR